MTLRSPVGLTEYDLGWWRIFMAYLCSLSEVWVSKYWKQEFKSLNTHIQTCIGTFSWRIDKSWIQKTKARRNSSDPSTQVYHLEVVAWHRQLSLTTGKQGRKEIYGCAIVPRVLTSLGSALIFDSDLPPPRVCCQKAHPCALHCSADPGLRLLFSWGQPT